MALLSSFGQSSSVGTPGVTTKKIAGGVGGLLAGGPLQPSTTPFANGGNSSPQNLNPGLNLGNGVKSLGIQAKSPDQNVTPPSTAIPQNQIATNQTSGSGDSKTQGPPPAGYAYSADGSLRNASGDLYTPPQNQIASSATLTPPANSISNQTGSGQAPAGMQYDGQGQLVPINSFGGATGALTTLAGGSTPEYQAAQKQYADANQQLADLKTDAANQEKNIGGSRTNLSEAGGEQGLLANLVANKSSALTGEMSAAQSAAQVATGQQGTQQQGLGTAGGLLQPQVGAYGQTQYSPLGGTVGGNSAGVQPSDPFYQTLQTYAKALASGQGSAIPASITGNPALQAQLLQMAQQINPSFNYNTATGQGAAQQSNAATAGTASTTANQGVYNDALGKLANYQNMAANIRSFGDQSIQNISSLPLTSSQLANTTIQQAMTQFNDPKFAQFNANIQGLQARVSALLGTGEIPSSATAGAQAIVNGNLNLGALQATLNQINNEADAIVGNQATIASNAYANIQGSNGTTNTNSGNTGTATQPSGWF